MRIKCCWLFVLCVSLNALCAEDPRPNILFCIADDWSFPHAGILGDKVIKTPTFDSLAKDGVLFKRAYCAAPSCSPSRAAILTGQPPHRLEEGGNLWGTLPKKFDVFPDLLEKTGYIVGLQGKGWGPGSNGDRPRNPAGPNFKDFNAFMKTVAGDKPFCFWFGSHDPHRPYVKGQGVKSGMKIEDVEVPPYLPDTPEVRSDILDYYFAVQRFDRDVGEILNTIEEAGRSKNTIVIMTSDNGWPFPRCKTNMYETGSHMPLAVRWPAKVKPGQTCDDFIQFIDYAPTILEAAGLKQTPDMIGHSFLDILVDGKSSINRQVVFVERERHANVREGDLSYPCRSIRTKDFLYIRNLRPNLWPAGDPIMWKAVGPFGDIDGGPTKEEVLKDRGSKFFRFACEKRPEEELYDLRKDKEEFFNVAGDTQYEDIKAEMRKKLEQWMKDTNDPRVNGDTDSFDKYPYFGDKPKNPK